MRTPVAFSAGNAWALSILGSIEYRPVFITWLLLALLWLFIDWQTLPNARTREAVARGLHDPTRLKPDYK